MSRSLSLVVVSPAVLLLFVVLQLSAANQYRGDECNLNGRPGICQLLQNCEEVRNELLEGKFPGHLCGYERFDPVICCPTNSTDKSPNRHDGSEESPFARGAISRAKCEEYSQAVFELQQPSVLLPNLKPVNVSLCAVGGRALIVGGRIADSREFPHMAAVGYITDLGLRWLCGGTLISERFVLTAAHCTYARDWGSATLVRLGDLNLLRNDDDSMPEELWIIDIIKYPGYISSSLYHDIALLKLERDVIFNAWIRPACLPYSLTDVGPNNWGTATGWGHVEYGAESGSIDLMKVTINLVPHKQCTEHYENLYLLPRGIVDEWQFCAGGGGKDTCQGDSGGPMVTINKDYYCMYSVFGVTSLGQSCGDISPAVYTRVYKYIPWIESIVWPNS